VTIYNKNLCSISKKDVKIISCVIILYNVVEEFEAASDAIEKFSAFLEKFFSQNLYSFHDKLFR
jgi:hypothetical protein